MDNSKKIMKARPTIYKGIQMRSRLEAGFAAWLDKWHFDWEYEPCAFASEIGQYLPDFRLRNAYMAGLPRRVTIYVEVKPDTYGTDERGYLKGEEIFQQAKIIAASDPDAHLILMQPNSRWHFMPTPDGHYASPLDLVADGDYGLGFAVCLEDDFFLPWKGEYWKPKAAGATDFISTVAAPAPAAPDISAELRNDWERIVGAALADRTRLESLQDGELTIAAESSAWVTQLRLLAGTLIRRLNEELGDGTITRIAVLSKTYGRSREKREADRVVQKARLAEEDEITRRVACPQCGAAPGTVCRTTGSKQIAKRAGHADRQRLARES